MDPVYRLDKCLDKFLSVSRVCCINSSVYSPYMGRSPPSYVVTTMDFILYFLWSHHYNVCVVCVFFPSILDIKFVGRTSRGHTGGRSHRIFNPPSFCGACLDFCREKDSAIPFPRRP